MLRLRKALALALTALLALSMPFGLAEDFEDGIYDAVAQGMNGEIEVHVVVFDNEIIKITADHSESDDIGAPAIDALIQQATANQSADVDAVAGATETSEAFIEALEDALDQASGEGELEVELIFRRTPVPTLEPEPEPESETVSEPVAEPEVQLEPTDVPIVIDVAHAALRPTLRDDTLTQEQLEGDGEALTVLGNDRVKRGDIRVIEFVDTLERVPGDAWDVSEAGDCSAVAWIEDGSRGKKLVVAGREGVTAPDSIRTLFARYDNLETIAFNGCFHTGDTTDLSDLFYGCRDLKDVDFTGFDTGSARDMSGMFYGCDSLTSLDLSGAGGRAGVHMALDAKGRLVTQAASGFTTSRVERMDEMFAGCSRLREIAVSDSFALLDGSPSTGDMFEGCAGAVVLNGKALSSSDWLALATIPADMKKGDDSEAVKWLQRGLIRLDCLSGSADGDFGNMTEKALKSAQAELKLPESGVADLLTLQTLCDQLARMNRKQPTPGDLVSFGHYEQDGDSLTEPEPIEWIVVAGDDKTATLLSRYALDAMPYSGQSGDVTWESSSLRKWLNADFLKAAFTDAEQAWLQTMTVEADTNPRYSTDPGKATKDKICLPSAETMARWLTSDEARVGLPTPRALENGAKTNEFTGACWWLLRTPGSTGNHVMGVAYDGSFDYDGAYADFESQAFRPMVTLVLEEETSSGGGTGSGGKKSSSSTKKKKKTESTTSTSEKKTGRFE